MLIKINSSASTISKWRSQKRTKECWTKPRRYSSWTALMWEKGHCQHFPFALCRWYPIVCEVDRNQVHYLNPTLLFMKLFHAEKCWIGCRTRSLTVDDLLLNTNLSMERNSKSAVNDTRVHIVGSKRYLSKGCSWLFLHGHHDCACHCWSLAGVFTPGRRLLELLLLSWRGIQLVCCATAAVIGVDSGFLSSSCLRKSSWIQKLFIMHFIRNCRISSRNGSRPRSSIS